MCHDYEFEMLKRAHAEEMARRNRAKEQASKAPQSEPAKPAATPSRDRQPVPA